MAIELKVKVTSFMSNINTQECVNELINILKCSKLKLDNSENFSNHIDGDTIFLTIKIYHELMEAQYDSYILFKEIVNSFNNDLSMISDISISNERFIDDHFGKYRYELAIIDKDDHLNLNINLTIKHIKEILKKYGSGSITDLSEYSEFKKEILIKPFFNTNIFDIYQIYFQLRKIGLTDIEIRKVDSGFGLIFK